jgi:hypothetical protein
MVAPPSPLTSLRPAAPTPCTVQAARRIPDAMGFSDTLGANIIKINSTLPSPVRRTNFRPTFPPPRLAPVMLLGREREEKNA